jgi:hypothetical protein
MYAKRRFILPGLMALAVLVALAMSLPVAAQEPCIGDPECYFTPTPGSSSGGSSGQQSSGPAAPPWSGLSDGRLNPHPAEYYSLFCKNTFLEIWRGAPTGSLLQFVPIWLLDGLNPDGGATTIPNYGFELFNITRNGDLITVSGNYGNGQPPPGEEPPGVSGEKVFSLSECITRNDGPIGSAPAGSSAPRPGFFNSTSTVCYGPDSEVARRGLVPPDQICDEGPTRTVVG